MPLSFHRKKIKYIALSESCATSAADKLELLNNASSCSTSFSVLLMPRLQVIQLFLLIII